MVQTEFFLDHLHGLPCRQSLRKIAYYSETRAVSILIENTGVQQSEPGCHRPADSVRNLVGIGVGCINGYPGSDGLDYRPGHGIIPVNLFQPPEYQRMMGNDHIRSGLHRLVNELRRAVEAHEHSPHLVLGRAD